MISAKRIGVLLAEDHIVIREGLRRLLEAEQDIEVVGEAATGRQAVRMTQELCPSVVIMDIGMPQLNGMEATRQIRKVAPDVKVLILSAHSEATYIEKATASGAMGYLIKHTSSDVLFQAIRAVQSGNTFFSPGIDRRFSRNIQNPPDHKDPSGEKATILSSRETEVLQLIAEGETNKQIAAELTISIKTVEKHRGHLMQKLHIHDTANLTRYAIAEGIASASYPAGLHPMAGTSQHS